MVDLLKEERGVHSSMKVEFHFLPYSRFLCYFMLSSSCSPHLLLLTILQGQ